MKITAKYPGTCKACGTKFEVGTVVEYNTENRTCRHDVCPLHSSNAPARRAALNPVELWAAEGLLTVAGMDPDRASTLNGVGFSKHDGEFGHSLAEQIAQTGLLSERQWTAAVKLATKYRRQIGPKPEETPDPTRCHCGGVYVSNEYCGADVCGSCGEHRGLVRCYCGWSTSGRNGRAELIEMGETIGDED